MQDFLANTDSCTRSFYMNEYLQSSRCDSVKSTFTSVGSDSFQEIRISPKPQEVNVLFFFFLICFLMSASVFSLRGKQTIGLLFDNLFHLKSRQSIFYETTGNDFRGRLFLLIQSVLLTAIIGYTILSNSYENYFPTTLKTVLAIGGFSLLISGYLLYKWIGYKLIATIFFNRASYEQWIENWMSVIALHAMFIFFPALLLFYVPAFYDFNLYLLVLWFFVIKLLVTYKSYIIFFNSLTHLHYFFLYLCAHEIVPLFLLYKGILSTFNLLETRVL